MLVDHRCTNSFKDIPGHLVEEWNFSKTKNFLPEDVTAESHRRVWWKCTFGHEEFDPIRVRVEITVAFIVNEKPKKH
ncbi:zinc-ribbon domain-containing protein [Paenibacillus hubeiensis]|uniref:zinc-ribbon domain-containing protein n=1 Tax=Paenibacillus hubeiensis TaxID=3077330 RepID=UPI003F64E5B8